MKITVSVKPNAKKSALEKVSANEFKAHIKSPPEKGKANEELTKLLAREFKVLRKNIEIKTKTARKKQVHIHNN